MFSRRSLRLLLTALGASAALSVVPAPATASKTCSKADGCVSGIGRKVG